MTPPELDYLQVTPELKQKLQKIYITATDPKTSDNYASKLKRDARRECLAAGEPRENWPDWVEPGAPWRTRADRTQPVKYHPELPKEVIAELEHHRERNNPAEARALCRQLGIEPPPWARR